MKKIISVITLLIYSFLPLSFVRANGEQNFLSINDLRINELQVGERFSMERLNDIFGGLRVPVEEEEDKDDHVTEFHLIFQPDKFANMLTYRNDFLYSIFLRSMKDKNDKILMTPRGIHIGSFRKEVMKKYGQGLSQTDSIFYYIPDTGSILFKFNNGLVNEILISLE